MIDQELLKEKVKLGYVACFHDGCPRHATCLRWQGRTYVSCSPLVLASVNLANPDVGGETCPMYSSDQKVRMGRGIKGLLSRLPRRDGNALMAWLRATHCRTYAYEYRNGTRPIPPQMQQAISDYCRQLGWTGPVEFDGYSEQFEW